MSKKIQKHCRIINYLKAHHEKLAEAIEAVCLARNLNPFREYGLTFVVPTSELQAEIEREVYGPNPENALPLINGHIILANLTTETDIKATNNKSGFKLSIKRDGKKIDLNGLEIEPTDFKAMSGKNITVWKAVKGRPTIDGEKVERGMKHKKPVKKAGGSDQIVDRTYNARQQLLNGIQNSYATALIQAASGGAENDLTETAKVHVASILNQLKATGSNDAYNKILKKLDPNPVVSALAILNPSHDIAPTLINAYNGIAETISAPLGTAADYTKYLEESKSFIGQWEDVQSDARNRAFDAYDDAGTTMGGVNKVIMGAYEKTYGGSSSTALLHDLMRYDVGSSMKALEEDMTPSTASDIRSDVQSIFARARSTYGGSSDLDVQKGLYQFNSYGGALAYNDEINASDIVKMNFVNSSDFLYSGGSGAVSGGAEAETYFDRHAYSSSRYSGGSEAVEAMRAKINSL